MAETIGIVTNIKLATITPGFPNAIDVGAFRLLETATGINWLFYLWISHAARSSHRPRASVATHRLAPRSCVSQINCSRFS